MKVQIILVIIQIIIILSTRGIAQSNKANFEMGLYYFKAGDYSNAIAVLSNVANSNNDHSDVSNYLIVASNYYLGNFGEAVRSAESFKNRFPSSNYLFDVIMTQLIIYFETKQFDELKNNLNPIANLKLSETQKLKLDSFLGSIINNKSPANLEKIFRNLSFVQNSPYILKLLYRKAIEKNDFISAKEYYSAYQNSSQTTIGVKEFKIGVLFPLGDETKLSPAIEILEGLKFIVHKFNGENELKISLIILNTEGNEKAFERNLKKLVLDPDVICVIGPIYSELLRKVSSQAEQYFIPMISPTSTSTDLAEHRKFVLQFNPNYEIRGRAMAEYCINKLGLKRLAVLTQSEGFAKYISEAFISHAKELNIDFVTEQFFDGTVSNLTSQLVNLRKKAIELDRVIRFNIDMPILTENKLIKLGLEKVLIDSLIQLQSEKSVFELFGKYGDVICNSEGIKTYKRTLDDILNYDSPIYSLDGVYLSISDRSVIKNLIPHFKNFGFRTSLFGSDAWYAPDDLLFMYPSSDRIVFTSDYFNDEETDLYIDLAEEFSSLSNLRLTRNVFYGIETMLKISTVMKSEKLDRFSLILNIQNDNSRSGISSQIMLNEYGINNYLNILQFSNRSIDKIDEIILNPVKGNRPLK